MSENPKPALTQVTDTDGNYIKYTPDAMGNTLNEQWYDSQNNLLRSYSGMFNTLGELYQRLTSIGPNGTTTYGYDGNGNQTTVDAPTTSGPPSRNTTHFYDALNRLNQVQDATITGVAKFSYDGRSNRTNVQDPNSFNTSYTNDGFGGVTNIGSPDTGTTSKTYDTAGNLKTSQDARIASISLNTNYYDSLNRLTQQVYPDQAINFFYDSPAVTNGIGRLTGASDATHSITWGYDAAGRVSSKSMSFFGLITKAVGYTYVNDDLVTMTTPSGQTITYEYASNTGAPSNHRITSVLVNGRYVVSSAKYDSLGPVSSWVWGSTAQPVTRSYTTDGFPKVFTINGTNYTYSPDNALRIHSIDVSSDPANIWAYGYDVLDRITSTTSRVNPVLSQGYSYDANGNRKAETGTVLQSNTFNPGTNQLLNLGNGTANLTYYPGGYTASGGGVSTKINGRGRLASATTSVGTTSYYYDALGQLFYKNGPNGSVGLMYDERGHIIGEYTNTGVLIQETVWMDDIPVATLRPFGSTVAVYYIHTDHLGTPRQISSATNGSLVWTWDPNSFGSAAATSILTGSDTFTFNLRFPGQYYQSETGFIYNYYRDYIPGTGTYVEPDPIGLAGGSYSTYAYVGGNPVGRSDPLGLVNPGEAACIGGPNPVCDVSVIVDVITTVAGATVAAATISDIEAARKARDAAKARATANSCPPGDDGSCDRDQKNLLIRQARLITLKWSMSETQYAGAAKLLNAEVAAHNTRCRNNQVMQLPLI